MTEKTRFKPGPFQARTQKTHVPSLKKPTSGYEKPVVTPERVRQEPGGGGNLPPKLGSCGRPPPTLDGQCRSFLFLFVFVSELGPLPKNSGPNPGSFYIWIGVAVDPRRRLNFLKLRYSATAHLHM